MHMRIFTHYIITLKKRKVTRGLFYICVSVQKGRVGAKNYILFSPPTSKSSEIIVLPFCKGHLTFFARLLCKHWVGTQCYYVMLEIELVQDEHLWLKVYLFFY